MSEISAQQGSAAAAFDGGMVKVFGTDGALFWEFKSNGRLLPYMTRSREAAVYVCRTNGEFIALNRAGTPQWNLNLGAPLTAPPLSGWDGRLFVFLEKAVICLTATGHILWRNDTASPFACEPRLNAQGGFIALLKDNTLLSVSAFGVAAEIPLASAPSFILPVTTARNAGRILVIYPEGRLELYDKTGQAQGGLTHLNAAPFAAAAQDGLAAILLASGQLVLLDTDSARVLWRSAYRGGAGTAGNPAQRTKIQFDERRESVYVLSVSGAAAFSKKDGIEQWSTQLENAAVTPAFDEGILYSGGRDWILYAYRMEQRSKTPRRLNQQEHYGLGEMPSGREWSQVRSAYPHGFAELLDSLTLSVGGGTIGGHEIAITRLLIGITSDTTVIQTERVRAVRLLGIIGSGETIPFLVRSLRREHEPSVKTEIAIALGRIGCDPQGRVFDSFERIINLNQPVREEALLAAVAAATGNICRFSGPQLGERGIKLLVALSNNATSPAVQHTARRELKLLLK